MSEQVMDRLMKRVVEDGACWAWTGAVMPNGYGVIRVGKRTGLTHRVSYAFFITDVPAGLELDHLCRNRACINSWHLEPVTRRVNTARGESRAAVTLRSIDETGKCPSGHDMSLPDAWAPQGNHRVCRLCRNGRTRKYQAAANARRRWRRANDPVWAEQARARDRARDRSSR